MVGRPKIHREGVRIVKTMVYLEEGAHKALKHEAVEEETSMTNLIRKAVDQYLERAKLARSSGKEYQKGGEEDTKGRGRL